MWKFDVEPVPMPPPILIAKVLPSIVIVSPFSAPDSVVPATPALTIENVPASPDMFGFCADPVAEETSWKVLGLSEPVDAVYPVCALIFVLKESQNTALETPEACTSAAEEVATCVIVKTVPEIVTVSPSPAPDASLPVANLLSTLTNVPPLELPLPEPPPFPAAAAV